MDEKKINIEGEEEVKQNAEASEETIVNEEKTSENIENAQAEEVAEAEEKDPLEAAQEEIAHLKEQMLYKAAEFDNYRKRTIKEKAELIKSAAEKLMVAELPVVDDMDRALENMEKGMDADACIEGFKLIVHKFKNILTQNGLEKIETDGQEFDTDYHEAIALIPAPSEELKGKILDCVQPGYKLGDKVIRHAKVAVGQ